jgi:outer membrane protein TolC
MNETMKSIVLVSVLLALWLGGIAPGAQAEEPTNQVKSLTLRECIERALAQNLDIRIERINPTIQQWGVVSAQSVYDPLLSGGITYEETTQPLDPERAASLGISSIDQEQLRPRLNLGGLLPLGTQYGLNAFDTRTSGTLASNFVYTGTASASLTQPILKNFGLGVNSALIRVARKSRQIAGKQFVLQVITTVSDVNKAYYELIFAIEDHKAKIEDLNRAKALLDENRKRVRIGVLSPLDVTQAEAGVAEREEAVIIAERVIRDNENTLKRLMSQNVMEFYGVSLVPVDYPTVQMIETDVAYSINTALKNRPDYVQAKLELERRDILVKYNRNQLWPEIDLQGSYGFNGRSSSGFDDFIDNTASGNSPVWIIGVTASFPLGNRQARASYHTSRLQAEQQLLSLKRLEQDIIVGTDNAVRLVQSNLKRMDATRVASRLAEESLRAEEQKLRAGTSTSFLVLQAQAQLAAARSAEIRARSDYSESLVDLASAEGTTLTKNDIVLDEKF